MSAVDSSGAGGVGGGGGSDDDPSNHISGSGSGDDDNKKKKNHRDRKDQKNWVEVALTSRRRSSAQSVASSNGSTAGGGSSGGGGGRNVVVNPAEEEQGDSGAAADHPDDDEDDEAAQELYRENLAQATQNSIMETVGAYSVVPGSIPSRRESGSIDVQQDNSDGRLGGTSSGGGGANSPISHDLSNLPMGIDIIAEATLVVPQEEEEDDDEENGQENYEEEYDDDDVDTLGLPHYVSPDLGGAIDNDGVSVMSCMTNPTTMQDARTISSHIEVPGSPSRVAILDDEEAQHHMATATVESATCETHDVSASTSSVDASVTAHSASQQQQHQDLGTIYEAEIVEDGPMNILRSKSGRVMCTVAVAIILTLSIGLALGLTLDQQGGGGGGEDKKDQEYVLTPPDPNEVLNHAGGNFCNAVTPIVSFDQYPSHCTADEVRLGGTIQQAVAIAQRRPHPYCVEVEEGSKTPDALYGWHVCSVTNATPQISLLNGGAVRGEIAANSPITRRLISNILPFTDDTVSYLQLRGSDVIKVLENAIGYVTQVVPLNPYLQGAYPYASGLKFSVDLTADEGTNKVSNVQVSSSRTGEYGPIDESSSYWIVTNEWIANGGDGYLTDVTPMQVVPTKLSYTSRFEKYLTELDGYWEPPVMPDEMSTVSFNAEGIPVASMADVEPIPET